MARKFFIMSLILYFIGIAISMDTYDKILDQDTPLNMSLKGMYKKSFGYHSLVNRMPDVFIAIINSLRSEKFHIDNSAEVNHVIEELKSLLSEVLDNKPLRKIDSTSNLSLKWNQMLEEKFKTDSPVTWFETEWLLSENYLYMRINEIFEKTKTLQNYDPFKKLKNKAFDESEKTMIEIATFFLSRFSKKEEDPNVSKIQFLQMLKISLWGNRFDLSLNIGKSNNISDQDPLDTIKSLDKYILTDQSEEIWNTLNVSSSLKSKRIDIIMDNSAYELFTDLCLADYFITNGFADVVVFHGKSIPWYVSDVTKLDFEQFLNRLEKECTSHPLQNIGKRWHNYYNTSKFIVECEDFWTLPYSYSEMASHDSELYQTLATSQMLIFKGDLNYRKLIGDINWSPLTTFEHALREFHPTKIVALRTLKCDCICGLDPEYEKHIDEDNKDNDYILSANFWQVSGKYAVIQLSN